MTHKYLAVCVLILLLRIANASEDIEKNVMKFMAGQNIKILENFDTVDLNFYTFPLKAGDTFLIVRVEEYSIEIERVNDNKRALIYTGFYDKVKVMDQVDGYNKFLKSDIRTESSSEIPLSSEIRMVDVGEEYAIYNIIDVPINGNCLYECFCIAWSILKEIDSDIKNFKDQFDVRQQIYKYFQTHFDYYRNYIDSAKNEVEEILQGAWGDYVQIKIFSDLFRVNIIVYQKEKDINDVYIEVLQGKFVDSTYNHTIRLAHINPENPNDSPIHYVLLQKDNIVEEEYQWYPKKGDSIKHISTEKKYRVIAAPEEEFISVRDLNDNEDWIIDFNEESIYDYTRKGAVVDHKEKKHDCTGKNPVINQEEYRVGEEVTIVLENGHIFTGFITRLYPLHFRRFVYDNNSLFHDDEKDFYQIEKKGISMKSIVSDIPGAEEIKLPLLDDLTNDFQLNGYSYQQLKEHLSSQYGLADQYAIRILNYFFISQKSVRKLDTNNSIEDLTDHNLINNHNSLINSANSRFQSTQQTDAGSIKDKSYQYPTILKSNNSHSKKNRSTMFTLDSLNMNKNSMNDHDNSGRNKNSMNDHDNSGRNKNQWYPKKDDVIKHTSTGENYIVIGATEEEFICVRNIKNNEESIIEREDIYQYTQKIKIVNHEEIHQSAEKKSGINYTSTGENYIAINHKPKESDVLNHTSTGENYIVIGATEKEFICVRNIKNNEESIIEREDIYQYTQKINIVDHEEIHHSCAEKQSGINQNAQTISFVEGQYIEVLEPFSVNNLALKAGDTFRVGFVDEDYFMAEQLQENNVDLLSESFFIRSEDFGKLKVLGVDPVPVILSSMKEIYLPAHEKAFSDYQWGVNTKWEHQNGVTTPIVTTVHSDKVWGRLGIKKNWKITKWNGDVITELTQDRIKFELNMGYSGIIEFEFEKNNAHDPKIDHSNRLMNTAEQFDGKWELFGGMEEQCYEIKGQNLMLEGLTFTISFNTSLNNYTTATYTKEGISYTGFLKNDLTDSKGGIIKCMAWSDHSIWKFCSRSGSQDKLIELSNQFNIGDHVEVLNGFYTNTLLADRVDLRPGQKLMIKKKKNDIIFVLNTTGKLWNHLQPIDSTNLKNLKYDEWANRHKQIFIKEVFQ